MEKEEQGVLRTEVMTHGGLAKCVIKRVQYCGQDAIYVDMWRSEKMPGKEATYTAFSTGVYMRWDEHWKCYRIWTSRPQDYRTEGWMYLEHLLSCLIITNE